MKPTTVTLRESDLSLLNELSGDSGAYESRSEAIRAIIDGHSEVNELQTQVERLQREKRMILEQREENQELVSYVQREKAMQERREERTQANVIRRAWWWVAGTPG
jgi:Arc/MetJ-type ribon-helix-helix transcriptional regulator